MSKKLILTFFVLSLLVFSAQAQSFRLQGLANDLQRNASNLAEKKYQDFNFNSRNSQSDSQRLLNIYQFKSDVDLFRRMVNDVRPELELKYIAFALDDLARRNSSNASNRYEWQQIQRNITILSANSEGRRRCLGGLAGRERLMTS